MNRLAKILDSLENRQTSLISLAGTLVGIIVLRGFLETLLIDRKLISTGDLLIHYPFFFLSLFISLSVLLAFLSGRKITQVAKVLVPFYAIIITPPLLDSLIFGIGRFSIGYVLSPQTTAKELATMLFTYYGLPLNSGVTLGIRIEIFLGMIGTVLYVFNRSGSLLRGIVAAIGVYLLTFFYLTTPFFKGELMHGVMALDFPKRGAYLGFSGYFFILLLIQIPIFLWLWGKERAKAILGNMRPFRIVHFWLMLFLGLWIGLRGRLALVMEMNFFDFVWGLLMVMFGWLFSVAVNDIVDVDIDRVSNRTRPLAKKSLTVEEMIGVAFVCFLGGVVSAGLLDMRLIFLFLVFCGIYWVYSVPPIRLKRIPFVATAAIALNSLVPVLVGITMTGKYSGRIPWNIILGVLCIFTLASNIKDLKDFNGDKKAGISTLMTLWGEKKGRKAIGFLAGVSYSLVPVFTGFLSYTFIIVSFIFGLLTFIVIVSQVLEEKGIFIVYFLYFLVISLFWGHNIKQVLFAQ